MGRGVHRPSVQHTSNFERTVHSGENTMELRSAISSTFHNVVEKQNSHRFKNWRWRRRRFCLRRPVSHIYQGLWWLYPGYCACV